MNWLDVVLLFILTVSTFLSLRKGFSREVISLAASFFALLLGMWFYGTAASLVQPYVDSPRIASLLGFLLVVAGVLLIGSFFAWIVGKFLRTVGLSFFDRLLGAIFGLARGLLVSIALLTAFMAFGPHAGGDAAPSAVVHSKIAPYVLEASRVAVSIAPMDLKQSFRKYYSRVKSTWQKTAGTRREEDS